MDNQKLYDSLLTTLRGIREIAADAGQEAYDNNDFVNGHKFGEMFHTLSQLTGYMDQD